MSDGDVSLLYRILGRDEASPAFNKVGKSAEGLHTKMIAVGSAIGTLAANGVMALGGMAAGAVKTGLQTAAAMQQAQLGFATLLGSEKAAGSYMQWLTSFAASTPFEMQGLVESSRTLIGVGVSAQQTKGMLQDFGDAASAIGIQQDAFQRVMLATSQAISAGKFQAGDLNQIMTNGLPVWTILSKAMHKSVPELRDLASHGKLLAKDVLPALQGEMHKDYGGAMAKQSQTLNGLWSTFQDTIHLGMANVLKPLIPILQKELPGAMDTLSKWMGKAADASKGFIDGLSGGSGKGLSGVASTFHDFGVKAKQAFEATRKAIEDAWPKVKAAIQFVVDHKDVFGALAAGAASGAGAYKALAVANGLYGVAVGIATAAQKLYAAATRDATVAQVGLDVAMDANPIGAMVLLIEAVVVAVVALVAGLIYAYQHSETFRNIVNGAFGAVRDFVVGAVDKIKGAWDTFTGALSAAKDKIGSVVGGIATWFQALPGKVESFLSSLPGKVWDVIKSAVEKGAYYFGYGLGLMVKEAMAFPGQVIGFLQSLPGKVWDLIKTLASKGAAAFASFVTTVAGKAADLAVTVGQKAAELVSEVVAFLKQLPGKALAAIRDLPGKIKAAVSDAGTWLLDAGKQVVMGLVNGIKNAIGAAVSAVKDIAGNVVGGFKDAMGIHSPSRVMAALGQNVVEGLLVGLKQVAPQAYSFMDTFAKRIGGMKVTQETKYAVQESASDWGWYLQNVTQKLAALKGPIQDQQKAFDDLVKAKDDYANSLTQGVMGSGSIAGIGLAKDETDTDGNVTKKADVVGEFVKSLQTKSDAIKKFGDNVNQLRAEGLSDAVIQQIQQSGLETGGALASALATATPTAVKSINDLSDQITTQSTAMGKAWAGDMYDAAVNAAQGILDGLKSQQSKLLQAVREIAQAMVDEIKKSLKIKSPSGVMRDEVGAMIPAGLVAGIQAGAGGVASAMASLVRVPQVGTARVPLGADIAATGGGGAGSTVILQIPHGFVGSPQQLATALSEVIQRAKGQGVNLSFGS